MRAKIKRAVALLLSVAMVMSMTFVSSAATSSRRYERPEIGKADTVRTTGAWAQDANGLWTLNTDKGNAAGGWYYANVQNSSTDYSWYYFNDNGIMAAGWVIDQKDPSIWYYTSEAKDGSEGKLVTGWITDPQDGYKYYLSPATGIMSYGWVQIDGAWYYFCPKEHAVRTWAQNVFGYWAPSAQSGRSYGSMYRNEKTPDGYYVDENGVWKQTFESSGSSSSSSGPSPRPVPVPDPVMTATASTATIQYAGHKFDTTDLEITIFKDGAKYDKVKLPDSRIPEKGIKVVVNGEEDADLNAGDNEVKINFVYYDGNVIIGGSQDITTEAFEVDGITHTVEFYTNQWQRDPYYVIPYAIHDATIEAPKDPEARGYRFMGWYKTSECRDSDKWDFATDTVTEYTALYAKWIYWNQVVVTFDVNGHGTAPESQTETWGYTITKPADPVAEGYVFDGWYKDAECTDTWVFSGHHADEVYADTTLYAKWTEGCTVTFDLQGHGAAISPITVKSGSTIDAPTPKPAAEGYTFGGWYKDAECTDDWIFSGYWADKVTENTTLYAKWTKNTYTVDFHRNGHNCKVPDDMYIPYGEKITKPDDPSVEGYNFGGWYRNSDCTGEPWDFDNDTVTGNTDLYAKWTKLHTVTFNANGHGTAPAKITDVEHGSTITNPGGPTDTRHTFDAWCTREWNSWGWTWEYTEWNFATDTVTDNITLYATWEN